MGRHWHFVSLLGWILTGVAYVVLLFATGQWRRYIPLSWSIFPQAWNDILAYLSFHLPPLLPGEPFDAVQKLVYAAVIFLLAPFQILTGAAQSPAVEARFPRYVRLWGGRQGARTLHFFGLIAFIGFIAVHLTMVGLWSWPQLNALMIFGDRTHLAWATVASFAIIAAIIGVHVAATMWSLRSPRSVQRVLGWVVSRTRLGLLRPMVSRQDYPTSAPATAWPLAPRLRRHRAGHHLSRQVRRRVAVILNRSSSGVARWVLGSDMPTGAGGLSLWMR